MLTPIGLSPMACMHAVRSGVTRLALQPIPIGSSSGSAAGACRGGRVQSGPPPRGAGAGRGRAGLAVRDDAATRLRASRIAVLIGAPEPGRPGFFFPATDGDGLDFIDSLGLAGVVHGGIVRAGPCHGHVALQRAAELFKRDFADACVIASADSLLQIRAVRWLEDQSRLKCSYVNDGLMPAEGAACVVVEPECGRSGARHPSSRPSCRSPPPPNRPPSLATSEHRGRLTAAARTALVDASMEGSRLGDGLERPHGESYRAREWAFTEVRLGVETRTELQHPADCHGDLGGVTDVNLLALAAMSLGTGWTRGQPCLVFAGSESGFGWRAL
jgi:hypothetical protein